MNKERELLNWSKAEHGEIEDKEEEKDDGEWKSKESSRHNNWYFQLKHPILIDTPREEKAKTLKIYLTLWRVWGMGRDEY